MRMPFTHEEFYDPGKAFVRLGRDRALSIYENEVEPCYRATRCPDFRAIGIGGSYLSTSYLEVAASFVRCAFQKAPIHTT